VDCGRFTLETTKSMDIEFILCNSVHYWFTLSLIAHIIYK